jgi:hypothetical protein
MRTHSAFSLTDLLMVVAIITVLSALLLPALRLVRETARGVQCQSSLRQIGVGMQNRLQSTRLLPKAVSNAPGLVRVVEPLQKLASTGGQFLCRLTEGMRCPKQHDDTHEPGQERVHKLKMPDRGAEVEFVVQSSVCSKVLAAVADPLDLGNERSHFSPLPLLKSGHKQLPWRLELYFIPVRPDGVAYLGFCAIRLLPKSM